MNAGTPAFQVDAVGVPSTLMLLLVLLLTALGVVAHAAFIKARRRPMIRTFPLGTTGPRRQPTLLGFIRQVELELKNTTPRPQPRPVPPLNSRPA